MTDKKLAYTHNSAQLKFIERSAYVQKKITHIKMTKKNTENDQRWPTFLQMSPV